MPPADDEQRAKTPAGKRAASLVDQVLEIDRCFAEGGITHAFGGALALAYYTSDPRTTADIDINIALDTARVLEAFQSLPAQVRWRSEHVRIAQVLGEVKLRWMRQNSIDLFFATHRFHTVAHSRAETVPFAGRQIPILTATDLTVFKAKFARDKDWLDIEEMIRAGTVDTAEALRWAGELLGTSSTSYNHLVELASRA